MVVVVDMVVVGMLVVTIGEHSMQDFWQACENRILFINTSELLQYVKLSEVK